MRQKQVEKSLTLVFCDISLVPLGKGKQTLVPDNGQLSLGISFLDASHGVSSLDRCGIDTPESQEVENERVNDLVWQCVLLLKKRLDEDVDRTATFATHRRFLSCNVAKTLESGCGMENRNGDSRENGLYNVRLA